MSKQTKTQDTTAALPDRIDAFLAAVRQYIQWTGVRTLTFQTARPTVPGSPAEKEQFQEIERADQQVHEAAARIRRDGPGLASALQAAGIDPNGALRTVHCAAGGSGAEALTEGWADIKIRLQAAALRLRNPGAPSVNGSDGTPAFLAIPNIMERLGIAAEHEDTIRKRLERTRKARPMDADLFVEVANAGAKQPHYLYNAQRVQKLLQDLSGICPASKKM